MCVEPGRCAVISSPSARRSFASAGLAGDPGFGSGAALFFVASGFSFFAGSALAGSDMARVSPAPPGVAKNLVQKFPATRPLIGDDRAVTRHLFVLAALALPAGADPAKPPHGATKISIDHERIGWQRSEEHHVIEWKGGRYVTATGTAVDAKLIDDLYASLGGLREATQKLRCRSHTDDYPKFKVVVEGAEPLVIESESNCGSYRPWSVEKGGKRFVQFSGQAWRGVGDLMAAVNKDWVKRRYRMSMGGMELIHLGDYPGSGEPAACAKSFESDAQLKRLFGDPTLRELSLTCDLHESADCSTTRAKATFSWRGVEVSLDVSCSGGAIKLPARFAETQAALTRLVDSKPVRALVKTAPKAPRLWKVNDWIVQVVEPGFPTLSWSEGATTIGARIVGASPHAGYWKELGIDAARLPRRGSVVDVQLDFAGKLP